MQNDQPRLNRLAGYRIEVLAGFPILQSLACFFGHHRRNEGFTDYSELFQGNCLPVVALGALALAH
jgi:hypothetical protein